MKNNFSNKDVGQRPLCLELFSGAGGLALAAKKANFTPLALFEKDPHACETLRLNEKALGSAGTSRVFQEDLKKISPRVLEDLNIDAIIGGPPCQPFSRGGAGNGPLDDRDLFPNFRHFVHHLRPKAFVIENVAGLTSPRFYDYFKRILGSLAFGSNRYPTPVSLHDGEPVFSGSSRPDYRIYFKVLNAADFGVPQMRLRLFMVGVRNDCQFSWKWPSVTHSKEALMRAKFVSGEYFAQHELKSSRYVGSLKDLHVKLSENAASFLKPHVTVRDALADLGKPVRDSNDPFQHYLVPGARAYPGHTGSLWDEPAKTIKAGVHGCPGGENMVRLDRGRVRYFTVRELARLQSFPDNYRFHGTRNQCVRQIGNAVPVLLGSTILAELAPHFTIHASRSITAARASSVYLCR